MRVLHVSTPQSWRGGEQQAAYLCLALHEQGLEVTILTPSGSRLGSTLEKEGLRIVYFQSRGLMGLSLAAKMAQLCRTKQIDLIHTHDAHAHTSAVLASTFFGMSLPIVVSRRVDFAVSSSFLSRWKYNHPAIARILCVSETIRRITSPAIKDPKKLSVVYSGIDLTRYAGRQQHRMLHQELRLPEDIRIVGNLSALADHKDYPVFIETARLLMEKEARLHFIIAGTGPEEDSIRKLITEKKLENHISLLGFRKDVTNVMLSLDAFLITSKTEGLGTIVLEAFAAGIPVISTAGGGITELVEDGVTGCVRPVGDAPGLAEEVLRVLSDASFRQKLIDEARRKAELFSFRKTAAQTKEIYEQVLRK